MQLAGQRGGSAAQLISLGGACSTSSALPRYGPKLPADAGHDEFRDVKVLSTVLSDPLCREGHAFSDPFGELATDGPFDRATD